MEKRELLQNPWLCGVYSRLYREKEMKKNIATKF